ncbi:hypothetical protein [Nocardioides panacisoli]|uniref:Uncharacterized protein n=1 Tax=Nocardioides panacisoli TaxID=627624 RepID=A0ABP7INU0_9ACTN
MTTTTVTLDDLTVEVCCLADHEAGRSDRAARQSWLHGRVHVVERSDAPPLLIPGCEHLNEATVAEAVHRYRLHQVA